MPKTKVALLYGGKSAEHEVSINSAKMVLRFLNPKKYKIFPIYITKQGKWFLQKSAIHRDKSTAITPCVTGKHNVI